MGRGLLAVDRLRLGSGLSVRASDGRGGLRQLDSTGKRAARRFPGPAGERSQSCVGIVIWTLCDDRPTCRRELRGAGSTPTPDAFTARAATLTLLIATIGPAP